MVDCSTKVSQPSEIIFDLEHLSSVASHAYFWHDNLLVSKELSNTLIIGENHSNIDVMIIVVSLKSLDGTNVISLECQSITVLPRYCPALYPSDNYSVLQLTHHNA